MFETGAGLGNPYLVWIWLAGYLMVPLMAYLKLKWMRKH